MPDLTAEMRRRYKRYWEQYCHPTKEWWEASEGDWRRRRAVVRAEIDDEQPKRGDGSREDIGRRESVRVRWRRSSTRTTTLERLREQLGEECNSAQRGAEPEIHTQGEMTEKADNTADNAGADQEANEYTAVCVRSAGGAIEISQDSEIINRYGENIAGPERRGGTAEDKGDNGLLGMGRSTSRTWPTSAVAGGHRR